MHNTISKELISLKNLEKAKILCKFFKTGKGEYGEGDKFLGLTVPQQREIAKKYFNETKLSNIEILIKSEFHEIRMTGFLILCFKYEYEVKKKNKSEQENIIKFYLSNLKYSNNRDLVDLVCYKMLGHYLMDKDREILYKLSESKNLREQRVSIVSTMIFVRNRDFNDALMISKKLLSHPHDLIHKAVGWILREIGKKDERILKDFLNKHIKNINRTTLRYAIERMKKEDREYFMKK